MSKVAINDIPGAPIGGKYGSAMIVAQNIVFISGVVGKDDSGAWVSGGIKESTKAAIANAQKRLQHIGLDLKDVCSATVYLLDYKKDFAGMNEAYIEAFEGHEPLPSRTCVGVAQLPNDTPIEITFTAIKPSS